MAGVNRGTFLPPPPLSVQPHKGPSPSEVRKGGERGNVGPFSGVGGHRSEAGLKTHFSLLPLVLIACLIVQSLLSLFYPPPPPPLSDYVAGSSPPVQRGSTPKNKGVGSVCISPPPLSYMRTCSAAFCPSLLRFSPRSHILGPLRSEAEAGGAE